MFTMEGFSKSLREWVSSSGRSQAAIARELNIRQQTFSTYLTGRTFPPIEILGVLASAGFDLQGAFTGTTGSCSKQYTTPCADEDYYRIPIMSLCGAGRVFENEIPLQDGEEIILPKSFAQSPRFGLKNHYALRVEGDSMQPVIQSGTYLIVREIPIELMHHGLDYVVVTEDGPMLKKVLIEGESVRLHSHNPKYQDIVDPEIFKAFAVRYVIAKYAVPWERDPETVAGIMDGAGV